MLKLKDGITIEQLKKYGIRKHKDDPEEVVASKWGREWVEADTTDGFPCGSSGYEFSPVLYIKKETHFGKEIYAVEGKSNFVYYMPTPNCLETIYKLAVDGIIEIYEGDKKCQNQKQ